MTEILFRCSSLGKLMTEPRSKAEGPLSVTAKTYIRELVAQDLFGVEFEISSKPIEKGLTCEPDSIALLNRVRGTSLVKNTERRSNGLITGECDLFNAPERRGHDLKTSWSIQTFPIVPAACYDKAYEWQARGYCVLWDADEWSIDYALITTPDRLLGAYDPLHLHVVDHVPEHMRITSWVVKRDRGLEEEMFAKVRLARSYYSEVLAEFAANHPDPAAKPAPTAPAAKRSGSPLPASIF